MMRQHRHGHHRRSNYVIVKLLPPVLIVASVTVPISNTWMNLFGGSGRLQYEDESSLFTSTLTTHRQPQLQFWADDKRSYVKKNFTHTYPLANVEKKIERSKFSLTKSELSINNDFLQKIAVRVVYYVNTKINEHYNTWIEHQLSILLQGPQSIHVKELYIVADAVSCTDETNLHNSAEEVKAKQKKTTVKLECHDTGTEELFEYNGIHKLWEIGQTFRGRHDVSIYFHSKGITRARTWDEYIITQGGRNGLANLTSNVFSQMDRVLEAFSLFPFVNVVGWDCSKGGFVWYNFFYARGSYLRTVEEPIATKRRHYYEDWLRRAGLEPQQIKVAPNGASTTTKERPKSSYPPLPGGHCYGLAADFDPSAANIGYYFNKKLGRRVVVDRT